MVAVAGTRTLAAQVKRMTDPPVARALFSSVKWAWIWLPIRLYVGYEWFMAGFHKVGAASWTGAEAGAAITGFANGALAKTAGEHPDVTGWYASFLQHLVLPYAAFWSFIVAWGEVAVGIALIVGLFTGLAAFFGSFMNVNYLMAGTVSSNPILFVLATWLVLAWKVAGWWGLDRFALPALGTPWKPGVVFQHEED